MFEINDICSEVNVFDFYHCINRQGFQFTAVAGPANILDAIVVRAPENCDCWCPKKSFSSHTLGEHIAFINAHKLEKACVIAEDLSFITQCPTLKYLEIIPANSAPDNFDYSPLYRMPEIRFLNCATNYGGSAEPLHTVIDYSKVHGLRKLFVAGSGNRNYHMVPTLEELYIHSDTSWFDLQHLKGCPNLKSLCLTQCATGTLEGIQNLPSLQQLCLDYCRRLKDISELKYIPALRWLSIENCPRIDDFVCLQELKSMEYLYLHGKNKLPSLDFLKAMKKLRVFTFSMDICSCDLTPCLAVAYAECMKGRRQYNLKNKDLPKNKLRIPFQLL